MPCPSVKAGKWIFMLLLANLWVFRLFHLSWRLFEAGAAFLLVPSPVLVASSVSAPTRIHLPPLPKMCNVPMERECHSLVEQVLIPPPPQLLTVLSKSLPVSPVVSFLAFFAFSFVFFAPFSQEKYLYVFACIIGERE